MNDLIGEGDIFRHSDIKEYPRKILPDSTGRFNFCHLERKLALIPTNHHRKLLYVVKIKKGYVPFLGIIVIYIRVFSTN